MGAFTTRPYPRCGGRVLHSSLCPYAWHVSTQQMFWGPHGWALQRIRGSASKPFRAACHVRRHLTNSPTSAEHRGSQSSSWQGTCQRRNRLTSQLCPALFQEGACYPRQHRSSASSTVPHFPQQKGCCLPASHLSQALAFPHASPPTLLCFCLLFCFFLCLMAYGSLIS